MLRPGYPQARIDHGGRPSGRATVEVSPAAWAAGTWRRLAAGNARRIAMKQGGYVTLVGYVAREPRIRQTKSGRVVADMRVGTTPRFQDRATGLWRDGETTYYTVDCWRRLAEHARASLHKGDPVVVQGWLRTDSYTDRTGTLRTEIKITAETVGHDLSRGIANYIRPERPPANAVGDPDAEGPRGSGDAVDGDMIDEQAIEQFGRELDDLDEAELSADPSDSGPAVSGTDRSEAEPAPHGFQQDQAAAQPAPPF
jgi:single-strand DNA-binding protein